MKNDVGKAPCKPTIPNTAEIIRARVAPDSSEETWRIMVLHDLFDAGPKCRKAASFIVNNDVQIYFGDPSPFWGMRWLPGAIGVDPDHYSAHDSKGDQRYAVMLGGIVHEAKHLEDPILALSVQGEVIGWRAEYEARRELEHAGFGTRIEDSNRKAVANTPNSPTDADLRAAEAAMLRYTRGPTNYLVWLLPLRPVPAGIVQVTVRNLLSLFARAAFRRRER